MVLGLAQGNTDPKDMDTKLAVYKQVRELNSRFIAINETTRCAELLSKHTTEDEVATRKHHKILCRKLVGDAAELVYEMVNQ